MKKKNRKKLRLNKWIIRLVISLLIVVTGYQFYNYFHANFYTPNHEPVYLYIRPGDRFTDVVNQLKEKTKVKNMHSFIEAATLIGYDKKVRPGRYLITDGMDNESLLYHLSKRIQSPVHLTFNNLRTKEQLAGRLAQQLMLDSLTIIQHLDNPAFDRQFGFNPQTVTAMFIPNTYDILWDVSMTQLMKRMKHEYTVFWDAERLGKAKAENLTPIEVITLASIVEEETNRDQDKPIIAGLYLNRLHKGMPLQSCPTVKFALQDFSLQRITGKDLQVKSPYNTYHHKGLPPGPIRLPSIESIDAVLNYTPNNYLYMCAKETLNGEHYFATTWAEQKRNAAKYAAKLNELGIYQ
ncbi:MAG: endolytic transglycosylase MltG [Microbacter sp.]